MARQAGTWNKWGDPLAGGNRLCRESADGLVNHLEAATNSGNRPAPLPRATDKGRAASACARRTTRLERGYAELLGAIHSAEPCLTAACTNLAVGSDLESHRMPSSTHAPCGWPRSTIGPMQTKHLRLRRWSYTALRTSIALSMHLERPRDLIFHRIEIALSEVMLPHGSKSVRIALRPLVHLNHVVCPAQ